MEQSDVLLSESQKSIIRHRQNLTPYITSSGSSCNKEHKGILQNSVSNNNVCQTTRQQSNIETINKLMKLFLMQNSIISLTNL